MRRIVRLGLALADSTTFALSAGALTASPALAAPSAPATPAALTVTAIAPVVVHNAGPDIHGTATLLTPGCTSTFTVVAARRMESSS